jgi:hypothetical protein
MRSGQAQPHKERTDTEDPGRRRSEVRGSHDVTCLELRPLVPTSMGVPLEDRSSGCRSSWPIVCIGIPSERVMPDDVLQRLVIHGVRPIVRVPKLLADRLHRYLLGEGTPDAFLPLSVIHGARKRLGP